MKTIALLGAPNCGKTTLFNAVTGLHQHVGNWPGVTVERREGLSAENDLKWVDLPGTCSLSPYSAEEKVTVDYLLKGEYDIILQIVDATALSRGLYLTHQLMQLQKPMLLALNMMDECRRQGRVIQEKTLSQRLGMRVVSLTARTGEGIPALLEALAQTPTIPPLPEAGTGREAFALAQRAAQEKTAFHAWKCMEGDDYPADSVLLEKAQRQLAAQQGMDAVCAVATLRYDWAERLCREVCRGGESAFSLTDAVDTVVLHPVMALPMLLMMLGGMAALSFGRLGSSLSGALTDLLTLAQTALEALLQRAGVSDVLQGLLVDGFMTGVASVVSFLPMLLLLFLCMALLEDSGYMARAAFLMDRPMRALGLNGQAFIPLLLGFGCSVPAALAAQTLRDERDRRFTLLLIPMMSCSAKLPVYAALAAFLGGGMGWVTGMCVVGVVLAVLVAQGLRRTVFLGEAASFVMELPRYRLPTIGSLWRRMVRKTGEFLRRACTVILLVSMLIWLMGRFTWSGQWAQSTQESILGSVAGWLTPIFAPLGFGTMEVTAALLSGLLAKESIISTLAVLGGQGSLHAALSRCLPTVASTASLMTFVLLYPPCMAASAAIGRGMNSRKMALAAFIGQFALAWGCAWLTYRLVQAFL